MTTRKAPDKQEEEETKRQRRGDILPPAVSFESLNSDCLVHIFSFLASDDMNSLAECNHACSEARRNETLDQTAPQTGTIVCTNKTTIEALLRKLSDVGDAFTGKRTRLRIVGLDNVSSEDKNDGTALADYTVKAYSALNNVTSLDCSCAPTVGGQASPMDLFPTTMALWTLKELDFSNLVAGFEGPLIVRSFCTHNERLTKFSWNGCCQRILQCGHDFEGATNLCHIYLDGVAFSPNVRDRTTDRPIAASEHPNYYLLMECTSLDSLSLKGATVLRDEYGDETEPLSQDALIKMVRGHSTLRWLRSDLTLENVAMLKQERPDITFVSE
jgi:hypothetical protein